VRKVLSFQFSFWPFRKRYLSGCYVLIESSLEMKPIGLVIAGIWLCCLANAKVVIRDDALIKDFEHLTVDDIKLNFPDTVKEQVVPEVLEVPEIAPEVPEIVEVPEIPEDIIDTEDAIEPRAS